MTGGLFEQLPELAEPAGEPQQAVVQHGGKRPGAGRPQGAVSRVSQELREYLIGLTGRDAIVEQYRLAALPLMGLDDDQAEAAIALVMRRAGCSRKIAFDLWLKAADLVYDRIYPRLGAIELTRRGAPGNPIEADDLFAGSAILEGRFWPVANDAEQVSPAPGEGDGFSPAPTPAPTTLPATAAAPAFDTAISGSSETTAEKPSAHSDDFPEG